MLKERNNYKKLFLIKILFFIFCLFVLQKKCFSCEETINYLCNPEQIKTDEELLKCYKELPKAVHEDCGKIIKQKVKTIKNKYKNEYIEKDEFIIDNMFNTNCRDEVLNYCNGRLKRKNHIETIVVRSKEKCLDKLIKREKRLTYNCRLTIHNYYNLMVRPIEQNSKDKNKKNKENQNNQDKK